MNLLPLFVAIPLGVGFLIPLTARIHPRLADLLSHFATLSLLLLSLSYLGQEGVAIYHVGGWQTPLGIDLRVDALTTLILLTVNGLAFIVGIYSIAYLGSYTSRDRYYSLLMFILAGTNGVVLTGDLFNLYVFVEVTAIASYALVAFGGESEDFEASFKYAVFGGLSSALILVGIGLLYGMTGTLNLTHLASQLKQSGSTVPVQFALGLFLCGFGVKAAVVPFHAWLPDAYPAAPAPISALLSGVVSKVIGLYVLARLVFNVFGVTDELLLLFQWAGGVTMVAGGLLALGQSDVKRLFAYSSISQVGLILLAFGFGTTWGVVGALYHLINHAAFKPLLFLCAGQLEMAAGSRELGELQGRGRKLPVTAATSLIGSLAQAGVPPFNGFWSKLIIVTAGIQSGHIGWALTIVVMSIVALAYQLRFQKQAFYSGGVATDDDVSCDPSLTRWRNEPVLMALPMILLATACLVLSLIPLTGFDHPVFLGPAADVLLQGVWER